MAHAFTPPSLLSAVIEYKYQVHRPKKGAEWQPGSNLAVHLTPDTSVAEVHDNWEGKLSSIKVTVDELHESTCLTPADPSSAAPPAASLQPAYDAAPEIIPIVSKAAPPSATEQQLQEAGPAEVPALPLASNIVQGGFQSFLKKAAEAARKVVSRRD